MYCTILPEPLSTPLGDDASFAYHQFRRMTQTLGSISGSFHALARSTTAAYYAALSQPAPDAWVTLVSRTAALVGSTRELEGIVVLNAAERDALEFFAAIVRENADLLRGPGAPVAAANSAPLPCFAQTLLEFGAQIAV